MSKKLIMTICVGMLTLSAFALASSASAQWMVNGTTLAGTQTLANTAKVDENGKLKAAGVTIECIAANLEGTGPQIEAGDKGSVTSLIFKGCTSITPTCTIGSETIQTVPITATATLGTAPAVNVAFVPKTKTIFATIKFNGAECALLGIQPVTGKAKISAPTGQTESVLQQIVANVSEASGELKVGSSAAELKGAALLQLSNSAKWNFL